MSFVPTTYDDWKHCITVKCHIPLTLTYVQERINALTDESNIKTQKFVDQWGDAHRQRTLGWFQQAADELKEQA